MEVPWLGVEGGRCTSKRRRDDDGNFDEPGTGSDNPPSKGPRTSSASATLRMRLLQAELAVGTPVNIEPNVGEAAAAPPMLPRRPKAANMLNMFCFTTYGLRRGVEPS